MADGVKTRKPAEVNRSSLRTGVTAEPMQGESRGTFDGKRLMAWSCACGWHGTSRELNAGPRWACVSSLRRRVEATVITGEQIRRARELLGWTPYRLAPRAGIGHTLLRQFEKGARPIDAESAARLRAALEEAGVEFLGNGTGEGVRLKPGRFFRARL
jgi:hypothetical protein